MLGQMCQSFSLKKKKKKIYFIVFFIYLFFG